MKSASLRIILFLAVVMVAAAAVLPVSAESPEPVKVEPSETVVEAGGSSGSGSVSAPHPGPGSRPVPPSPTVRPLPPAPWPPFPPSTPRPRTRIVYRQAETIVETEEAEGYAVTAIKKVNVRAQASIYSTRVTQIRSAGTEVIVNARVRNSSGEIWYSVKLYNGTQGYIRSDNI